MIPFAQHLCKYNFHIEIYFRRIFAASGLCPDFNLYAEIFFFFGWQNNERIKLDSRVRNQSVSNGFVVAVDIAHIAGGCITIQFWNEKINEISLLIRLNETRYLSRSLSFTQSLSRSILFLVILFASKINFHNQLRNTRNWRIHKKLIA